MEDRLRVAALLATGMTVREIAEEIGIGKSVVHQMKQRIEAALSAYAGRFVVVPVPNITHAFYGRDVGYAVERINLDEATEAISATQVRRLSTATR